MSLPIDPFTLASIDTMYRSTLGSLPMAPNATDDEKRQLRQAAVAALASLGARDAQEAMLATRIVTAHYAAMECFRRAAQPDLSDNMMLRLQTRATALSNLASRTKRELQKMQDAPLAHPVTEEVAEAAAAPQPEPRPPVAFAEPALAAAPKPATANDSDADTETALAA